MFPAAPHEGFPPCDRVGDAGVIERAFLPKPANRFIYRGFVMTAAGQSLAELRFGELAARDHLQAVGVGPVSRQTS